MQIKNLDQYGIFIRESIFNEDEGRTEFRNKFFERFTHLEQLRRKPIIFYLENGNEHLMAAISFLEKMYDRLQTAYWYKEVSNTTEEDNFKYLALAALSLAMNMNENIEKQLNFVRSFMNKEFETLSDFDINMIDFIIESYRFMDNIYVPWDGYTKITGGDSNIPPDPMDYLYNLLNTLSHKYFIAENKSIMHDIYRFALAYNLVAYNETGNKLYKDMAYKNQLAGLYINISSISI